MDIQFLSVMGKQLSGKDYDALDVTAVVLTGLSVVFAGLVILIVLVMLYGKIFETVNKNKAAKLEAEKAAKVKEQKADVPVKTPPKPSPSANIESGIEEETVAVIIAAIEAYGAANGKKLRVAGIKKASSSKGGYINAWSQAARSELTRPF